MPPDVRELPFDRLPKLGRDDVRALAQARRLLCEAHLARLCASAGDLLDCRELRATLGRVELLADRQALRSTFVGAGCAVVLERAAGGPSQRVVVEQDGAGATFLADRVLGSDGSTAIAFAGAEVPELTRGALAYLAARLCAASDAALVVCDVATRAERWLDHVAQAVVVAPIELRLAAQTLRVRVLLPHALLDDLVGDPDTTREAVGAASHLQTVALTLWAEGGCSTLPLAAASTLGVGDVVVLDASGLAFRDGELQGSATLWVDDSPVGLECSVQERALGIDGRTARGTRRETTMTTGRIRSSDEGSGAVLELVQDASVELRVELARFSLTVAQLTRLGPGDVLETRRRVGEAVTLRAGTAAIAEGDLVDVDGELGVRITRLLAPTQSEIV